MKPTRNCPVSIILYNNKIITNSFYDKSKDKFLSNEGKEILDVKSWQYNDNNLYQWYELS